MLKLRISGANLDADVDAAARTALDAAAARLAAEVRGTLATPPGGPHETPWRQTGSLQASIAHATEGDTVVVGSTSPYAVAQERGTRTIPPRPFLLPTAQRLAPDLASSIGQAVQAALTGAALTGATTHSAAPDPDGIVLAQSLLITPRFPYLLADPHKIAVPRRFMDTVRGRSGKEKANDIPSYARGNRRYEKESAHDYATRLMNERWGRGGWNEKHPDFSKIKKYGERNFVDPKRLFLLGSDDKPEI